MIRLIKSKPDKYFFLFPFFDGIENHYIIIIIYTTNPNQYKNSLFHNNITFINIFY
jgi:hypothetical protein